MKGIFILALLAGVYCPMAFCQGAAVQLVKMNTVYCFIANPFIISASKIGRDNLLLTTDNGKINANESSLNYYPAHPGRAVVYVSEKLGTGSRIIDSVVYRVKDLPLPIAELGGQTNGTKKASSIRIQIAPSAYMHNMEIDARAKIISFTVVVIRDSDVIAERHLYNSAMGCRFADDSVTASLIANINPGDMIWIKDIVACWHTGRNMKLNDIKLLAN